MSATSQPADIEVRIRGSERISFPQLINRLQGAGVPVRLTPRFTASWQDPTGADFLAPGVLTHTEDFERDESVYRWRPAPAQPPTG